MEIQKSTVAIRQQAIEHLPVVFSNLPEGVQKYLRSLPTIQQIESDEPIQKSKGIVDYLLRVGGYFGENIAGRDILEDKILNCIINDTPIYRCMPAFPAPSSNPNKIPFDDDHCFGMGDLVALLTRNHISGEIAKVHKPGSFLFIYWEPFIYEMNKITENAMGYPLYPETRITSYQDTLRLMINHLMPNVQLGKPEREELTSIYYQKYAHLPIIIDVDKVHYYYLFMKEELDSDIWVDRAERVLFNQYKAKLDNEYIQIKDKTFYEVKLLPIYAQISERFDLDAQLNKTERSLFRTNKTLLEQQYPETKGKSFDEVKKMQIYEQIKAVFTDELNSAEKKLFNNNRENLKKQYLPIQDKTFEEVKKLSLYKKIKTTLSSRKYLDKVAYNLAETAFAGSQKMASLLEHEVVDYDKEIRESVRADYENVQKKIGTPMIYRGGEGTPWHKVLVVSSSGVKLGSYKELTDKKKQLQIKYYHIGDSELPYVE